MTLGDFVRDRRQSLGMTQAALANALRVTEQTISNLERGVTKSLNLGSLPGLAMALQVPLPQILRFTQPARDNVRLVDAPVRGFPIGERLTAAGKRPAGELRYESDEDRVAPIPVAHPNHVVARLDGACMEPAYEHGWLVVCDAENWRNVGFIPGRDYYVQLGGDDDERQFFKRYVRDDVDAEGSAIHVFEAINRDVQAELLRVPAGHVIAAARCVLKCVEVDG